MCNEYVSINQKVVWLSIIILVFSVLASISLDAAPVKIMPLGDSITGSPGCWRALLWNKLQTNGYTNIDFVGTAAPQGCSITFDPDHEGHGGAWATTMASNGDLVGWLSATKPDMVIMHLGTNDIWNTTISTATIISAYSTLVDQMRASNSNMKILVAQILPMNPSGVPSCYQAVIDLNNAIPGWASGKSTSQSPIIVVDQWTGFNTATDTSEGVHPNDAGFQKMSDKWYPAIAAQLVAVPGVTPDPTAVPGTTIAPTSSPVILGDVNSNGTIDIVDALLVAQYYVGLNPASFNTAAADVNKDGAIDIVDALRIAQYYVGLISGF